jgi:hypothetical protein
MRRKNACPLYRNSDCKSVFRQKVMSAYSRKRTCAVQLGMSALSGLWPLCASRAVQSETIDATTDHDIVQPLTIRLLGFNFFGGWILPFVTVPKSRLLAR